MDWIIIFVSALFSGILGIGISNWYHTKNEKRRQKYFLLEQLIGNRYHAQGEKFTEALNKIFIVFNDSEKVLVALKLFHESVSSQHIDRNISDQRLLELFKSMCEELDINTNVLTDSFYLQAFNIKN